MSSTTKVSDGFQSVADSTDSANSCSSCSTVSKVACYAATSPFVFLSTVFCVGSYYGCCIALIPEMNCSTEPPREMCMVNCSYFEYVFGISCFKKQPEAQRLLEKS